MLPQSTLDYDVQLQRDMFDLDSLVDQPTNDLCFLYCDANLPASGLGDKVIHPHRVCQDLTADGYRWYASPVSGVCVPLYSSIIEVIPDFMSEYLTFIQCSLLLLLLLLLVLLLFVVGLLKTCHSWMSVMLLVLLTTPRFHSLICIHWIKYYRAGYASHSQ